MAPEVADFWLNYLNLYDSPHNSKEAHVLLQQSMRNNCCWQGGKEHQVVSVNCGSERMVKGPWTVLKTMVSVPLKLTRY